VRFQYFALRFCIGIHKLELRFRFGFIFCFVLLSALHAESSATQRTMNGFLCFNALQRWLSDCVTLLMVIRSLNYTFNRDTRDSHDDEINCNCVWQCFINIYCLSNIPKNTQCPFQMLLLLNDCFLNSLNCFAKMCCSFVNCVGFREFSSLLGNRFIWQVLIIYGSNCLRFHTLSKILISLPLPTKSNNIIINTHHSSTKWVEAWNASLVTIVVTDGVGVN